MAPSDFSSPSEALQVALQYHKAGRLQEAEPIYREILRLTPDHPEALHLLGLIALRTGKKEIAVEMISKAIRIFPSSPTYHTNLGNALRDQGKLAEAIDSYQQALLLNPDSAETNYNLGLAFQEQGRLDEAVECYKRAILLKPNYAEWHFILGNVLSGQGKLKEAVESYRHALSIRPDYAIAHNNLGNAYMRLNSLDDAIACYSQAVKFNPDYATAHNNLGLAFLVKGRLDDAIACYSQALRLEPENAGAYNNLGLAFQVQGRLAEAIHSYRQALAFKPDYADCHSNLIFALNMSEAGLPEIQAERKQWDQTHAIRLLKHRAYANTPVAERRLRIGYVSADFKFHSAPRVFGAMLVEFDPSQFEVFAYSNTKIEDSHTDFFRQHATCWRNIVEQSDDAVAELIRQDGIDILVDLSGHSLGNRLLVFARKPAPIQISAWGFALSTGLSAMDVFLADRVMIPPEEKSFYTEEVRYLPCAVSAYFLDEFPEVNALPALTAKGITFGSFNRLAKISEQAYTLWAQVLSAIPGSQLLLRTADFDEPAARERIAKRFSQAGIAAERIVMQGGCPWREYMEAFNRVDIALDPFPHGGGVTTLEGVMMGIPAVTLRWPTPAGRLTATILNTLGLDEWIAETPEQYLTIAKEKAIDLQGLATIRKRLRNSLKASIIGDTQAYVRSVEQEYRQLWRRWCARQQA